MVDRRGHAFLDPSASEPVYRQQVEAALQRLARLIAANSSADTVLGNRVTEVEDDVEALGSSSAPTGASFVTIASSSTLTAERTLTQGTGISIVDGGANSTVTISTTITQYTDEMARDAIGTALVAGTGIDITVSDGSDTITIDADITEITRWETVRHLDFAAWPETDFAAGGDTTYALNDGTGSLTWTASGTAHANSAGAGVANCGYFRRDDADTGDDSASGLRIAHDNGDSTVNSSSALQGPCLTIPLSSLISDFSPFEEYRFEIQITRVLDRGTAPTAAGLCVALYSPSGTPTGAGARFGGALMRRNGASQGAPTALSSTGAALLITDSAYAYTAPSDILSFRQSADSVYSAACATYSAGWPADTAYRAVGVNAQGLTTTPIAAPLQSTSLLVIGADTRSSAAGCVDFMVRRLRVLRRIR